MKRYIIIPCVLSIIWHSLFFGILKGDIRSGNPTQDIGLYLITKEQFDYLYTISTKERSLVVSSITKSLANKNSIWKETLDIIDISRIKGLDDTLDDDGLLEEIKSSNFLDVPIPLVLYKDSKRDIVPMYGDLFYQGVLLQEKIGRGNEFVINLKNNMRMGYYIQGPISFRKLTMEGMPVIDKSDIKAIFRFWVTRDGRVNQVIIEEGSSFPVVDSEMVNFIKTWRFTPVFNSAAYNYEWGVVRVRIFK